MLLTLFFTRHLGRMWQPQRFPPITFIIQDDIAAGAPDVHTQRRERGIRIDALALTIQLQVLFGPEVVRVVRVWIRVRCCICAVVVMVVMVRVMLVMMRWGWGLDALGDVGHDLFGAQHAVRIEPCVAVGRCDGRELVLVRVQNKRDFDTVFVWDLVLQCPTKRGGELVK